MDSGVRLAVVANTNGCNASCNSAWLRAPAAGAAAALGASSTGAANKLTGISATWVAYRACTHTTITQMANRCSRRCRRRRRGAGPGQHVRGLMRRWQLTRCRRGPVGDAWGLRVNKGRRREQLSFTITQMRLMFAFA